MTNIKDKNVFLSPFSAEYWMKAASEVKSVKKIALCAILIAARLALKTAYIPLGKNLNIYFGFLVNSVSGAICGPVLSLMSGAICDILGFVIAPQGPFMPVFTLIEMFSAFCYSVCLYSTKITIPKIALSKALVNVLGNIVFTSLAMNAYYGKGVYYYLASRIAKNILMLPLEIVLMTVLFNALTPFLAKMKLIPSPQEKMKPNVVRICIVCAALICIAILTWLYIEPLNAYFKDFFRSLEK